MSASRGAYAGGRGVGGVPGRTAGSFGHSQNSFVARHSVAGGGAHFAGGAGGRGFAGNSNSFIGRHGTGFGNGNSFNRSANFVNNRTFSGMNRGLGYGYGGYGRGYGGFGYGRGYRGYGGFGRYGYGGFWPFFGFYPFFGYGLGYGLGYGGYGGYGYGGYGGYGSYGGYGNYGSYAAYPTTAYDNTLTTAATVNPAEAQTYADRGEAAFKTGNYAEAVYDWKHALVDDPQNGTLGMLYAQALFAYGQYDEAAGATQVAMSLLPADHWGVVVKNYKDLYPNVQNYTDQLRALEGARNTKPEDPGLRFLLGFHYSYLGYPTQAIRELNKAVELQPQDEMAKQLLSVIKGEPITAPSQPGTAPGQPAMPVPAT
ncbi:MAG: tetratricopeptide repeat protein [Singulisphaera sp.]